VIKRIVLPVDGAGAKCYAVAGFFMDDSFNLKTFENLRDSWEGLPPEMKRGPIFVLPAWLESWWQVFGAKTGLLLGEISKGGQTIGIAPLRAKKAEAMFIGDAGVCDYLDFIITPGRENEFFSILLDELKTRDITRLNLEALRPDSTVLTALVDIARERGYKVFRQTRDVSVALDLPRSWTSYLEGLTAKQRHEVRRKLRRLGEEGAVSFRVAGPSDVETSLGIFLDQFRRSRRDKARFMNTRMQTFFEVMTRAMAAAGLIRFGFLELNGSPVASVLFLDYNNSRYLYNSGYDPGYRRLSVGLLTKVLCIKDAIGQGMACFNFLRGNEAYKYRLGGSEIPLYNCRIDIT
jgi:CelD/BcsL family acetyltransferase involved in cellulose biosynthesis